jgi:hypothetical protein
MNPTYLQALTLKMQKKSQTEKYLEENKWMVDFWEEMDKTRNQRISEEIKRIKQKNRNLSKKLKK